MINKLLFGISTLLLLLSCSSDDTASESFNTEGSLMSKGTLTLNDGQVITSRYFYEGTKLVKIIQDDATNVFTYSGERIVKSENYSGTNTLSSTVLYEYNSDGKLVKSSSASTSGQSIFYVYSYNTDGSVVVSKYVGGELPANIDNTSYLYFEDGELVKKVMTKVDNPTVTYLFTYDDKNNPRRFNPGYYAITYYVDWGPYATGNQHNLLSVTSENNYTYQYQYEYNSQGYPVKATRIQDGNLLNGVNNFYYQ